MLSVIGLTLDLVGAIALVLGLFGHAMPLTPGHKRSPGDVAHDVSFGIVGALLLSSGFALQSLSYFGVTIDASREANLLAAGVTLLAAAAFAWLLYGVAYLILFAKENRRSMERWQIGSPTRREPRLLRFWLQTPDRPEEPPSPPPPS